MSAKLVLAGRFGAAITTARGHPLAASVNWAIFNLAACSVAAVAVQSVADLRHASVVLNTLVAPLRTSHPSGSRLGVSSSQLVTRCPWPGTPAPENPLFLAASIPVDRIARSHNFMAPLRTVQPHVARGAGATSLQTVGMAVARNQQDGFANPKAALPPPSPDRQLLFRRRRAHHRTARHRA